MLVIDPLVFAVNVNANRVRVLVQVLYSKCYLILVRTLLNAFAGAHRREHIGRDLANNS